MKKLCVVWKESIYKNDLKCPKCGKRLTNPKTGAPSDENIVTDDEFIDFDGKKVKLLRCGHCLDFAGVCYFGDFPEEFFGMQGNLDAYKEKKNLEDLIENL